MAKKQFLYENVYNDLKQKIECGDLKPGDKLAVEEDMIAHYGVSAITVKKALNLLAEEHRIRRIRGKGSFVMEYPEVGRIEVEEKAVLPEKSEIIQTGEPVLGVILNISVPAMVCRSCMNWSSRPERRDTICTHVFPTETGNWRHRQSAICAVSVRRECL